MKYYIGKIIDIFLFRFYRNAKGFQVTENTWIGFSSWISLILIIAVIILNIL
jgi:hypothetical protein